MFVGTIVVGALLALMLVASARLKLSRDERSVETIHRVVRVPLPWFPWLAAAELAGATGVVIGLAVPAIGIAAAVGILLYFAGAVIAHLRVGDHAVLPPLIPGTTSALYLVLRVLSA